MNVGLAAVMVVFTGLGTWWGWRLASVALWTGTGPKWHRREGTSRRRHRRSVKIREQFWRIGVTGFWGMAGAGLAYVLMVYGPLSSYR